MSPRIAAKRPLVFTAARRTLSGIEAVTVTSRAEADGTNTATSVSSMNSGDRYPHLPNAPIIEAVIDWRVKLPPKTEITSLKKVGELFGPEYVFSEEERKFQFGIRQAAGVEAQLSSRQLGTSGYRFRSKDGLEIATLSQTGFSFSRLKPYTDWNSVFSEAKRFWDIYRTNCQVEEVSRIAARYVNRILFPLPVEDLGQYLTAPARRPPELPQTLASLLLRLVLHDPPTGIFTSVTQVIEGQPVDGQLPFILDIDAYIVKTIRPDADIEITSAFTSLREMKNRVFFATLTSRTIDMFK
jgi:uncharacterized protein (TIGR04255 family)